MTDIYLTINHTYFDLNRTWHCFRALLHGRKKKTIISFVMSVCPKVSTRHPLNVTYVKYIGDLSKIYKQTPNLGEIGQKKLSGTLHENLTLFYCCRRQKLATKIFSCNTQHVHIVHSENYISSTCRTHCYV